MQKRDFETYQKRFRDFEILPKFSETHVFRDTIRSPPLILRKKKVAGLWDTNSLHHVLVLSTSRAPDVVNRQKSKSQKKQSIDCY